MTLTQEKFNADGSSTPGALWNVPIKIMKSNKEVIEVLMDQKELIVKLQDVQEQDWYKVNPDFYGYYRVQYLNEDDVKRLKPAIGKILNTKNNVLASWRLLYIVIFVLFL